MEKKAIIEQLTEIFHEVFNDDTIILHEEMTANDVDNWDSLTHMQMISAVEKTFGIKFKLREINKLKTVGNLIELLIIKLS